MITRADTVTKAFVAAGFCCVGVLQGCASYHPRPLDPAASARGLQARSLNDPGLLRFVAANMRRAPSPVRWNLATLTAAAIYERPDTKIAAGQVQVAEAGERTAAEWPNPVLSLSPSYYTALFDPSPWEVGPTITQLIQTAGKRSAEIAQARERTRSARQQLAVAVWELRSQVRTALIDLWAARKRLALSRAYDAAARQVTGLVSERYEAGAVSAAALTAQRLTGTQAALSLVAAERQEHLAAAALATAVGVPVAAIEATPIDLSEMNRLAPVGDLDALRQRALTQRPEVLDALARYEATEATLRLEVARQYPDLNIGPGYQYNQGQHQFILAISLPLPILNQNQGPIASARAARQVAADDFDKVQTTVLGQIETAVTDWQASHAEAERTRGLLRLADRTVRMDRAAFSAGQIGRLQLAGSELARAQTELGALAASTDERTALGRLEDAFHHPFIGVKDGGVKDGGVKQGGAKE
jgi:outer membrane protein, heavy metal efflux system